MKVRETEIELLRIVIMILIIITHLAVWGTAKTENATILQQTTAEITNAIIRWHVNVFVIITGYFGIKSRKSMLNIIIMSVFYTWFLYGLQCIFCGYMTTVRADLAERVRKHIPNVLPLHLQEKYFDLPDQKL